MSPVPRYVTLPRTGPQFTGCLRRGVEKLAVALLLLLTIGGERGLRAQDGPSTSGRQPVVVDVRIEGNSAVPTEKILSVITTRATPIPLFDRYAILLADFAGAPPYVDSATRSAMSGLVDEMTRGRRLLNVGAAMEDAERIRGLYNGYGFHDAVIRYAFTIDTIDNLAIVTFAISESFRYRLRGIRWVYTGTDPLPQEVRDLVERPGVMEPGEPFSQEDLYADVNQAVALLKNSGYPAASLAYPPRVMTVRSPYFEQLGATEPFDSAEVVIASGRRVRFGQTDVRSDTAFAGRPVDREFVLDQLEFQPGEWYSREKLDQSVANVYELGLFDLVSFVDSVDPARPDIIDFRIFTRHRPQNDFRVAPEMSLERRLQEYIYNIGLSAQYSRINLLGGGEQLGVNGRLLIPMFRNEEVQGGLGLSYGKPSNPSFPLLGSKVLGLRVPMSYDVNVVDVIRDPVATTLEVPLRNERFALALELSWRLAPTTFFNRFVGAIRGQWNKYFNVRQYVAQYEENLRIESVRSGLDFDLVRDYARQNTLRTYIIQGDDPSLLELSDTAAFYAFDNIKQTYVLSVAAVGDRRNDIFSPSQGYLIEFAGELGLSGLFGFSGIPTGRFNGMFGKVELNYRYFRELGNAWTLALRGHAGVVSEFGPLPLTPPSNRFIVGGANSVRGWAIREMLATRSDLGIPSGASDSTRTLLELLRLKNGGLGVLELSIELRKPLFAFAPADPFSFLNEIIWIPFIDAGNAYFRDREDFDHVAVIPNIAIAAGVSIGYNTPVGPIRGGVGIPVYDPIDETLTTSRSRWIFNRQPLDLMVFHLGIGHAF